MWGHASFHRPTPEGLGHADIPTTINRYGHLLPGDEEEVGQRLTAWLDDQVPVGRRGMASKLSGSHEGVTPPTIPATIGLPRIQAAT
jgi:hypothetical protein